VLEKDFQTRFTRWAKHNTKTSTAFELKLEKGTSMPFSAVMDHQITALRVAKHGVMSYKIPDVGYDQKPFDCFVLVNIPSYVVIMFYKQNQKEFFMIDVDDFIKEKETSKRKSLTEDRAREIGQTYVLGTILV